MADLLLELLSEEIPSGMQVDASLLLEKIVRKHLEENKISFHNTEAYSGPRRISVIAYGINELIEASVIEKKGPKISAREEAITGFLKSNNITKDQLIIKSINNEEFYYFIQNIPEKRALELLEKIIPSAISELKWPKTMRWGDYKIEWIRPLRNILCILNSSLVSFQYAHLKSNNKTFGHRIITDNKEIIISNPEEYKNKLELSFVIVDPLRRKEIISNGLLNIEKSKNIDLNVDPKLLDEVNGLVEWPEIFIGNIDDDFLSLPKELLVTALRTHQKYFTFSHKNLELANIFAFVTNNKVNDPAIVIKGNEKVLEARLKDARFCYDADIEIGLENYSEMLAAISYHAKLGNMLEKAKRIGVIAEYLAVFCDIHSNDIKDTALLLKADLATKTVDEFPELQGIIGRYLTSNKYRKEISDAIEEHYMPKGGNDNAATTKYSAIFAIADKIDAITGLFIAGEIPTGSRDPFALRRAAIGILKTIIEHNIDISLNELILKSIESYTNSEASVLKSIIEFFNDRLEVYLRAKDIDHNIINSITLYYDNPSIAYHAIEKLISFIKSAEGTVTINAIKRVYNIIGDYKEENDVIDLSSLYSVNLNHDMQNLIKHNIDNKYNFDKIFESLNIIGLSINEFLDNVVINDTDNTIRTSRMNLLYKLKLLLDSIFSFRSVFEVIQ